MSTTELQQQHKIPVGGEGAPTYIGEFHQSYGDQPQQYHSYCREHPDFGTCGVYAEALAATENHLAQEHSTAPLEIESAALRREFSYRLETVAAYAHTRGRRGEAVDPEFIAAQVNFAAGFLSAPSVEH